MIDKKQEKTEIEIIWEKAGKNEKLTPEEFKIYAEEVARRRK